MVQYGCNLTNITCNLNNIYCLFYINNAQDADVNHMHCRFEVPASLVVILAILVIHA